mgnify:CR=1 FL=1
MEGAARVDCPCRPFAEALMCFAQCCCYELRLTKALRCHRTVVLPTLMQLKQRTQLYEQQQPTAASSPSPLGGDAVPPMFLCPITQVRTRPGYIVSNS